MGGGDLNLKKSWHPSTLRNIERVWKAEQKHEVEKQKIEQLQKELAEERAREEIQAYAEDQGVVKKKEERLDWMYQGPAAMVNRDDYLLGRKIDKTFEILQQHESGVESTKDDGSDIGSTMFSSQNLSGTATVDLANKIREDPLFNIMKKEKEQRKNLLTNPVKMKQLQELLKASLTKKSKKGKKEKKRKHQDKDSDVTKHQKTNKKHKSNYSNSSSQSDDEKMYSERKKYEKSSENGSVPHRRRHADERGHYREYDDFSDSRYNKLHVSDSKDRNSKQKSSYYVEYKEHHQKKYESSNSHERDHTSKAENKRKMDEDERARRLKEMQENAKWRDEQRKKNTKRYREEDEKEDRIQRVHTSEFLKPMLSKAANKGSLENRVKQKIFTIQRSHGDMDKNFARRS